MGSPSSPLSHVRASSEVVQLSTVSTGGGGVRSFNNGSRDTDRALCHSRPVLLLLLMQAAVFF